MIVNDWKVMTQTSPHQKRILNLPSGKGVPRPEPSREEPSREPESSVRASPTSLASYDVATSKLGRSTAAPSSSVGSEQNFPRLAFSAPESMNPPPAPVPVRDERLFAAIQLGTGDWKRELVEEYLGLVRGLLIKSMGPQSDVDDLVAEVFVGLFESARNIRSAGGLRSYIVSVTMNTARREFRRRKRFNLFFLRDEGQEIAERTPSVDDPKAKAALLQLHRILEGLDHEERLIFVLHVLEELPLQEAAKNLSVSLSTAKRRLKRANERIRRRVNSNPLLSEFIRERAGGLNLFDKGNRGQDTTDKKAPEVDAGSVVNEERA